MLRYMLFRYTLQSNPKIKRGIKVSRPVLRKYKPGVQISDAKSPELLILYNNA